MSAPFAIYVRVSEVGGRAGEGFASPEEQEAAAREWGDRNGVDVYFEEDECVDLDVSGGVAAKDRKLGGLIERCESGEFAGVVVRYEDRFARDVMEGALALRRLVECDARLVATATGFDSEDLTAEKQLVFNMMMSVAQAQRERNREARMSGKERAVARGVYCAPAPFGYHKDDAGRLVPNGDADTVHEIFRLRASGVGFTEIARTAPLTRTGVRKVVLNRAYLGEQSVPDRSRKGEPRPARGYPGHPPLVTPSEWEAANAVQGRAPVHTGLGESASLKGIARCGVCGSVMHVLSYGKDGSGRTYACTSGGHASMSLPLVERPVVYQLDRAVGEREPHVAAVIEGDTRYVDALAAVEQAQRDLAQYRDDVGIQRAVGTKEFAAGLATRKALVEEARRSLRHTPRPDEARSAEPVTLEEFDLAERRRFYRRCIAEVLVFPTKGRKGGRLKMRWQGSDKSFAVPPLPEPDPIIPA